MNYPATEQEFDEYFRERQEAYVRLQTALQLRDYYFYQADILRTQGKEAEPLFTETLRLAHRAEEIANEVLSGNG